MHINVDQLPEAQQVIAHLRGLLQVRDMPMSDLIAKTPEVRVGELRGMVDEGLFLLRSIPRVNGPVESLTYLQLELVYPTMVPRGIQETYEALYKVYSNLRALNLLLREAHGLLLDETTAAGLPVILRILETLQYGFYSLSSPTADMVVGEPIID